MEAFFVVVVLVVLAVIVLGALGGVALFGATQRGRARAEANAPALLDKAFDGRQQVTYKVNLDTPSYETVVRGAQARGYRLTHQSNTTADGVAKVLLFDRA